LNSSVCKWNTCFNQCRANNLSWTRSMCKKQCNCWFLEGEEETELQAKTEEEQVLNSSICKWNNCFNQCIMTAYNTRKACKKYCNCWFVEEEAEEESLISNKICRYNKAYKACMKTQVVVTAAGKDKDGKAIPEVTRNATRADCKKTAGCWFLEEEAAVPENEVPSEVATSSCTYWAMRCKRLGYRYVYCNTGLCSNYAVEQEERVELSAASCWKYAQRCKNLGYRYVYCSTGACSY